MNYATIGPLMIIGGLLIMFVGWLKEKIFPTDWEKVDPYQLRNSRDPSDVGCLGMIIIILGFIVMFAFLEYQGQGG